MNIVILKGTLSSAPVIRSLPSGASLMSLELTTDVDGEVSSVPVSWFDPPAEITFAVGAPIAVMGSVRRRFFRTGGLTQSRTEVVALHAGPPGPGFDALIRVAVASVLGALA